ncbi:MAG TPA: hypothetical protein DCX07_12105 [Phycisphaerales bacterium]|nr:hypothetical protein [Phycisphaerales bacterium]
MTRLAIALKALQRHEAEIEQMYQHTVGYQVRRDRHGADFLREVFAASVNERRGASEKRGRMAVASFDKIAEELVRLGQNQDDPLVAYQNIFERICYVPHVDQKISAMFLKFVVRFFGIWPAFRPHLFVPLDRVVLKCLKYNLQWDRNLHEESPSIKNEQKRLRGRDGQPLTYYRRFLDVQDKLQTAAVEAGVERILIDELWTVGQLFCREYPLCHVCWIRDACVRCRH